MPLNLKEPTLLLDQEKCRRNIHRMATKARNSGIILRPHFKTHQSHTVGRWFREEGIDRITVSSLRMAEYFAADGWQDITVAIPVNINELERIRNLATLIQLNLLVVSPAEAEFLGKNLDSAIGLFVEIDEGSHRTGVDPLNGGLLASIISAIRKYPVLKLKGFLLHSGQTYQAAADKQLILNIYHQSLQILRKLKSEYQDEFPALIASIGDTPSCSIIDLFRGADEIRPGNFVFYDWMQSVNGSCTIEDIAVCMACPVIARYPERNEAVIYGGAVHFSKEFSRFPDGAIHYGKVVFLNETGWSTGDTGMYVKSLSQEHGIIHVPEGSMDAIETGDFLGVLPVHSCLTTDNTGEFYCLDGMRIPTMRKRE